MDLEQLEKLNELKEKGLLSAEEFEKEKQKLLNVSSTLQVKASTPSQKNGVNWKYVGLSFLGAILYYVISVIIVTSIVYFTENEALTNLTYPINFICGIIMAFIAKKLKTSQYKNCAPAMGAFIGMWLLGSLAFWILMYEFLQIKGGYAVLKEEKAKK